MANKFKTVTSHSPPKKTDGSMTIGWQKTADEIIKNLFLENNIGRDRLPTAEESTIELDEIKE